MAIFSSKKNTVKKTGKQTAAKVVEGKSEASSVLITKRDLTQVILRPRVTEKATFQSKKNVYVFEVATWAGKNMITKAVKKFYNVNPVKVAVSSIPTKKVFVRGNFGTKGGGKKAYVYLKEGDKIETI